MKKTVLLILVFCTALALQAHHTVSSPNGQLTVVVDAEQGLATYAITFNGHQMLMPSRLGLSSNIGDFTKGLTIKEAKESSVEKHYDMTRTKTSHSDYKANQLDVVMQNAKGHLITVTFLVSNNDVAFRYTLHPQKKGNPKTAVIFSEASSFRLPDGTTTFISPQSKSMVGWERTKPSYEEVYSADAPMNTPSQFGEGYVFPALFHIGTDGWALISETGVTSGYVGAHLSDFDSQNGYTIAYPMAGELNGLGCTYAGIPVPGSTPWRTITIGNSLKPIVETTISYDVVEPLYQPSQSYQPRPGVTSWLVGL